MIHSLSKRTVLFLFLAVSLISIIVSCAGPGEAWTFIVTCDQRFYATEPYWNSRHFMGALEAIREVGKGAFMVSPGDVDPPWANRELIDRVLGKDYLWYAALGNHELEDTAYVEWLRRYNRGGDTLPGVVRKGPPGCEETTYSFDYANAHFVILNQYFDGKSDMGADGDMVPSLLEWLEQDLEQNEKPLIFILGHEPVVAMPDMDNGRIRHQGDSLDKYEKNAFAFYQTLMKYGVTAYLCGHTHSTSFANINGLWQIDAGHARGIEEDSAPGILFEHLNRFLDRFDGRDEERGLAAYFRDHKKQVKKTVFHSRMADAAAYREIPDETALLCLKRFYAAYRDGGDEKERIVRTFWENAGYRKSSFLKFRVRSSSVEVDIYRDDARGGAYSLRHVLRLR
jgi:hypothetical protein